MNLARPALCALLFAGALAGRSTANDTLFTTVMPSGWCGTALVATGDVDGDGRPDLAESDGATLRWISGVNGSIVRSAVVGTFQGSHVVLADAGDLDGDGVSDVFVGLESASAFSGATAQPIWQIGSPSLAFGHAVARIDDRDGDGRSEVLVGVAEMIAWGGGDIIHYGYEGEGRVEVRSGASGALLVTLRPPGGSGHGFGGSIAVVDDVDGDGSPDLAIAPFYQPSSFPGPFGAGGDVRFYSGATLAPIGSIAAPPYASTRVTALGDLDGDGVGEVALARIWEAVDVVSPVTGATIRVHTPPGTSDRNGQSVLDLGDVNGDGVADYAIGAPQPAQYGWGMTVDNGPGAVRTYSGATGAVLQTLAGTEPFGRFGWSLATVGDVDGDLVTDLVIGAQQAARVVAISGSEQNSAPNAFCVGGLLTGTQRARLQHTGTTSVAANDFALVATDALPGQSGLFVDSPRASMTPFGAGWRCIGSPFFRLGPVVTVGSGGSATRALDLNSPPASGGAGAIGPGTTVYFQFLFRDLLPNHGGRNASSALAVTFAP